MHRPFKDLGQAFRSAKVAIVIFLSFSPALIAQKLGVLGDDHSHREARTQALLQLKEKNVTHLLITGDILRGRTRNLVTGGSLEDLQELEETLKEIVQLMELQKENIFFLKGNYEDRGYFSSDPAAWRQEADRIIEKHVTGVRSLKDPSRLAHDDELGIIEIHTEGTRHKPSSVFRIAVSHKPLIPLPYHAEDLSRSLVQSPAQAHLIRNDVRRIQGMIPILGRKYREEIFQEPDTNQTMTYQQHPPRDIDFVIFGHTHIAGYFVDEKSGVLYLNPGSLHPDKKPADQYESYLIADLANARVTFHSASEGGKIRKFLNLRNEQPAITCYRLMKDVGAARSQPGTVPHTSPVPRLARQ